MKVSCGWEESEQEGRRRNKAPMGEECKLGGTPHCGTLEVTSLSPEPQQGSCPMEPCGPAAPTGHRSVSSLV